LLLVLGVLIVIALVIFSMTTGWWRGDGNSDGNRISGFASTLPIWIAVLIPVFATKKKKEEAQKKQAERPAVTGETVKGDVNVLQDKELRKKFLFIWAVLVGVIIFGIALYFNLSPSF